MDKIDKEGLFAVIFCLLFVIFLINTGINDVERASAGPVKVKEPLVHYQHFTTDIGLDCLHAYSGMTSSGGVSCNWEKFNK